MGMVDSVRRGIHPLAPMGAGWTDALTAISTAVIALGTPASLVFLGVQVIDTAKARRLAAEDERTREWRRRQPRITVDAEHERGLHGTAINGSFRLRLAGGDDIWEVSIAVEVPAPSSVAVRPNYLQHVPTAKESRPVELSMPVNSTYRPGDRPDLPHNPPSTATLVIRYTDAAGNQCERRQPLQVDPRDGIFPSGPADVVPLTDL